MNYVTASISNMAVPQRGYSLSVMDEEHLSIPYAFSCDKGGLVIIQHDELRDEVCDMAFRAFQPSAVRDEPKIRVYHPVQAGKPCAPIAEKGDRGDILIRGLWERGTACIIDM
jgi:hypothetical protein